MARGPRGTKGNAGGRPSAKTEAELARIRRQVRMLGGRQSRINLEFWISVRDDSRFNIEARLQAAAQIEDRYGMPKQAVQVALPATDDMAKLFDWRRDRDGGTKYAAPQGWNGKNGAAHTNGGSE